MNIDLQAREITPLRNTYAHVAKYVAWGANMNNASICAYGYGTAFTAPAMFHAMDNLGVAQYLTRLGLALDDPSVLDEGKEARTPRRATERAGGNEVSGRPTHADLSKGRTDLNQSAMFSTPRCDVLDASRALFFEHHKAPRDQMKSLMRSNPNTLTNPEAPAIELAPCDTTRRFVRVIETRTDGLVAFEFAIGWPDLCVELLLPAPAFTEFCAAHRVQRLDH